MSTWYNEHAMFPLSANRLQPFIDSLTLTSGILSRVPYPNLAFRGDDPISGRSMLCSLIGLNDRICLVTATCHPVSLSYAFHVMSRELVITRNKYNYRWPPLAHICAHIFFYMTHVRQAAYYVRGKDEFDEYAFRMHRSLSAVNSVTNPVIRIFGDTGSIIISGAAESLFRIKKMNGVVNFNGSRMI